METKKRVAKVVYFNRDTYKEIEKLALERELKTSTFIEAAVSLVLKDIYLHSKLKRNHFTSELLGRLPSMPS